jgi:hypothetical protein
VELKQVGLLVSSVMDGPSELLTATELVTVHPPAVTVTVYNPSGKLLMLLNVEPLFQVYAGGPLLPVTVTLAEPVLDEHVDWVDVVLATSAVAGCVTVVLAVLAQPLASLTVTTYVPAGNSDAVALEVPLLHA